MVKGREIWLVIVAASASFLLQALAWPLAAGRDGYSYLYYAYDFFSRVPEDRFTMMLRTPVAPFFDYLLLNKLGGVAAEIFMGISYVAIVTLLFKISERWGKKLALVFAGLLILHFGWGSLFHVISNDPPLAIEIPILLWALIRSAETGNRSHFFFAGAMTAMILLTRPGIYGLLAIFPFFLPNFSLRKRLVQMGYFLLAALPPLLLWGFWNLERSGKFAIAPGADVVFPLGRVTALEKNLKEENGPNSLLLAEAVQKTRLNNHPENAGLKPNDFFREHPSYFEYILIAEETWGPGQYGILKKAAWEGVFARPFHFLGGSLRDVSLTFAGNLKLPVPRRDGVRVHTHKQHVSFRAHGKDQWIPMADYDFSRSPPDNGIAALLAERGPNSLAAWNKISNLPARDGSIPVGTWLNRLAYVFPPLLLWIFASFATWTMGKGPITPRDRAVLALTLFCLATNCLAQLSMWSVIYEYRLPFDPVYLLCALAGLRRWKPQLLA